MPQWLVDLVGESLAPIVWVAIAAVIVIALAMLMITLARKAFGGSIGMRAKGRAPRLAVMDVAGVDQKRKLVLVRRDEVEHLILIGGGNDLVVESGILRVPAAARPRHEAGIAELGAEDFENNAILDRIMASQQQERPVAAPPRTAPSVAPAVAPGVAFVAPAIEVPVVQAKPSQAVQQPVQTEANSELTTRAEDRAVPPAAPVPAAAPAPVAVAAPAVSPAPAPIPAVAPPVAPVADRSFQPRQAAPVVSPAQDGPIAAVPPAAAAPRREAVPPQRPAAPSIDPADIVRSAMAGERRAPSVATAGEPQRRTPPMPSGRSTVPPVAPPAGPPRSMATPTLPARPQADTPVAPSAPASAGPTTVRRDPPAVAMPVFPTMRTAPSEASPPPATAAAAAPGSPLAPEQPAPAVGIRPFVPQAAPAIPVDRDAEGRQPLSVRSFASTIQNRRSTFEPAAPAEDPRASVAAPAVAAAVPVAAIPVAAQPALQPQLQSAPNEASAEPSLEDILSAELDADSNIRAAENSDLDEAPSPAAGDLGFAPSSPLPEAKPPVAMSLEQEMEQFLSEFSRRPPER
ncbi:flagellar biosynthetic protein FliO [Mangrovicella endophytica]|uniref:flagellar biosynthetic protein FliO n=1 Tax=Mangrovicella endophytica TaxID=2066697 RepID=UPI000C9E25A7|nr:flagellar biosynthetic protein FliO [Mangrovicella endophytica]